MEFESEKTNTKLRIRNERNNSIMVYADQERILQVLTNLVVNSIKYGKNWFAQIKAGAALFTNPLASVDGFDADAFLQEEVSGVTQAVLVGGERVPIFANANNWMSIGGGIAFGYKNINFELLYIDGILLSGC